MKKINWVFLFLLWIIIGGAIIRFGPENLLDKYILKSDNVDELAYFQDKYERFELVDNILTQGYYNYDNIDSDNMLKNAMKAYVDGIDDPYTVYMDAAQNSWFLDSLEWNENFEWIGAVVSKKEYYILIEEVIKESPAFNAGLRALDRIVIIDSGYVENETLDDAVNRIKWPAGSEVHLVIERYNKEKEREIFEVDIVRENIDVPSVKSEIIEIGKKKVWYIELLIIWEETENLFKKEVANLKTKWIDNIILDLRWNGGGLMPIAVEIASHFIKKWELVVSAKYRGYEDEKYYSKWFGEFVWVKTVVLIDTMTASAGEIIAMALQEQAWAKLIGTTSFGKWTIQTLEEFKDKDSLKYTIWKWFSPSGKNIDGIWISPDITVEFDIDNYLDNDIDNQLEEAKSIIEKY